MDDKTNSTHIREPHRSNKNYSTTFFDSTVFASSRQMPGQRSNATYLCKFDNDVHPPNHARPSFSSTALKESRVILFSPFPFSPSHHTTIAVHEKYIRRASCQPASHRSPKPERAAGTKRIVESKHSLPLGMGTAPTPFSPQETRFVNQSASSSVYLSLSIVRRSLMQKPLRNLSPQPSPQMQTNTPPFVPI